MGAIVEVPSPSEVPPAARRRRVVVDCPGSTMADFLTRELPASEFEVHDPGTGRDFLRAVATLHPDVAVIGRVCERSGLAGAEMEALTLFDPPVRVIALDVCTCCVESARAERLAFHRVEAERATRPVGVQVLSAIRAACSGTGTDPRPYLKD